ncbi:MAG: hypothetical protein E4H20_01630 [Spirochaetales bacterium]|nr:MAG: hypothetical protein E4H20_01630 [Spirochaetales bacterium]
MAKFRLESLFEDWAAKILSLAAAITLFAFYQLNRLEERPMSVPLSVLTNAQFVPASQYPRTVRLVLRGEANTILAILESDLVATLDLRGFTSAGVWRVPVKIETRGTAIGIDPLEIAVDPGEIAMSIEPRTVKQLKILPNFRGFLETGFELAGFSLSPDVIEAAGPESIMEKLDDTSTEAVELGGRSSDFSVQVKLQKKDSLIEFLSSDTVEFTAEVRKAVVYKTFQDLSVVSIGLKSGLKVVSTLPTGSARIVATRTEFENFVLNDDVLVADLSGIETPGVHTVAVGPRFPEGMEVESWLPMVTTVTVAVDKNDSGTGQ